MIGASFYIISRTAWNRTRVRFRRLREPRYLLGAIAGAAYFYFSIFRFSGNGRRSRRPRRDPPPDFVAAMAGAGTGLVALLLAAAAALIWLVPVTTGLLDFSKAEVQFLFPAPVPRRQILLHRILRSQLGLLFASVVSAVVFPTGSGGGRVRFAIAIWIVLVTIRLFFTGVTLARPRLAHPDRRARMLARLPLAATVGVALVLLIAFAREMVRAPGEGISDLVSHVSRVTTTGVAGAVLMPFSALARPLFAIDWVSYLTAVPGALAVLAGAGLWVLLSDEAFEAASDAAVEGRERQSAAPVSRYRQRTKGFRLAVAGRPEGAFLWKAATETVRGVNVRWLVRFSLPVVVIGVAGGAGGAFPRGVSELLAVLVLVWIGFITFMGPQILRGDLRQDLEHLVVMKTWPVAPGSVIRGEMLWPVALLTVIIWGLIVIAALLAPTAFPRVPAAWLACMSAAALLVAPGLVAAQYVIHNAAALFFPAWMTLGSQRPRGFDAMGQRLILLGGTWLALVLMVLPGGIAAGILWLVFGPMFGAVVLVPAALVCTTALLTEAVLATEALGPVYDRIDLTDIERAD